MNISHFMWTWNSFRLISLVIVWFVSAYFFFLTIELELIYKLTAAILSKNKDTHWDKHKCRSTDIRAFILSYLRFNISFTFFFPPPALWFKILICSRLKSLEKWVTYFQDMAKVARYAGSIQSCPTPCNPVDSSPPGSSVHDGTLQARILEWVAIHSSRGSSLPRGQIHVSYVSPRGSQVLYH